MKKGEKKIVPPPPAKVLGDFAILRFQLPGAPMTKKNHQQILRTRDGRSFVAPSPEWQRYERDSLARLSEFVVQVGEYLPIDYPVQVMALFYRQANVGDLNNYQAGLADLLQAAQILADDKFIDSWDGSRKLKDAAAPRVEVEITRYGAAQESLPL